MQHSQFSDRRDGFDRRVFCKAGVATAVGVVGQAWEACSPTQTSPRSSVTS
jgi:hypothetical protein